jgi:hypothetical protein
LSRRVGGGTINIERGAVERRVGRKAEVVADRIVHPSVDRDGKSIDQGSWVNRGLEFLGTRFGGATAFPKARGVWRDDERGGRLVWDEPVIVHCYAAAADLRPRATQIALGEFCREMGRSTNQGEVGLVIDSVYHPSVRSWRAGEFDEEEGDGAGPRGAVEEPRLEGPG